MTIGIFLFLVQCKKEVDSTVKSVSHEEINIDELTSRFKSDYLQFKNGKNFKSGKIVTLSDAIYEMDATFNATYAKANHPCGRIEIYKTNVHLAMTNDYEADYVDVLIAYDSTFEKVSDLFNTLNETNKQLMMLSIEDAGFESAYNRKLIITATIGFGTYQGDFGNSEKYLFNESATYNCDGDPAPSAPIVFETQLNDFFNTSSSTSCRYYFYGARSYATYTADLQNPLEPTQNNYLDYKIFYAYEAVAEFNIFTECLEYNQASSGMHEMQFYYDYYIEYADDWMNTNNENKMYCPESDVKSFDILDNNSYRNIYHQLNYVFRKRGVICDAMVEPLGR